MGTVVLTVEAALDEPSFDLLQADDRLSKLSRLSLTLYRVFLALGAVIATVFGVWYAWASVNSDASLDLLVDFGSGIVMFLFSLGAIWTQESKSPRSLKITGEGLRLQFRTRSDLLIPWPGGHEPLQILDYPEGAGTGSTETGRLIRLYVDPRWSVGLTTPAFDALVRRANEQGLSVGGRLVKPTDGRQAHRLVLISGASAPARPG
ncbi:MAG: hypothetical protein L3K03_07655 [Thermoplasmata archaeon]|nr:hypothetical protein [Thermoplasmata archaeon]